MKKLILILAIVVFAQTINSQSAYERLMGKMTTSVYVQKSNSNTEAVIELGSSFDRLIEVNSLEALYTGGILKENIRHNAVVEDQGRFANGIALANTAINLGGVITSAIVGRNINFNPMGSMFYPDYFGNWFGQPLSWRQYSDFNNIQMGIVPSSAYIPAPMPTYVTPTSSWNVFNPFWRRF